MTELSEAVEELRVTTARELLYEKIKSLLDAVKIPENIKDIPNLNIHDFRDLSVNEAELLGELLKVKTIKDLSKITYDQIVNRISLIKELIPQERLELLITASKYIVKAAEYKPLEEGQKIVIAGLDNAGKTALMKTIKKEVGISELSGLKPTKGASRDEMYLADHQILLVELGGQEQFRKFYIEAPDRFFLETDIVVYLIDIQDNERYHETLDYLTQILRSLEYVQEIPYFIILFSKCDPDVVNSPIFQEKYDHLANKVKEVFKSYGEFGFEIQTSSIYNIVTLTPSFSRMLKGLFSGSALAQEEKIEAMGKLLMKVVDLFLDTEASLNKEISGIRHRLIKIEEMIKQGIVVKGKDGTTPSDLISKDTTGEPSKATPEKKPLPAGPRGGMSVRAALLNELKQVLGVKFGEKSE